ncbi:MAG: SDR family oxidoreductase [Helicobacteraceae bacterium]|jgi:3-oxoacyl-[acyl-carrier protein] reductase|nr:SDR family oxidoreductase [Helicobacteraceae bacterium]
MLKGKRAVITGVLQGIGRTALEIFARNGADIFACAYARTDEFESRCEELSVKNGVEISPIYCDMSDNESVKEAAREIQKAKKPVDALINIAGVNRDALFHMITIEQLRESFQINFFSQIIFSQYITKIMLRNGGGGGGGSKSVVFTSSVSAIDGNYGQLAYAASKAALIAAVKTMSKELGRSNIRVNAVAPGVIKSAMTAALPPETIEKKLNKSALKRIGGSDEVANLFLFLASDRSRHITGQTIRIDGGIG